MGGLASRAIRRIRAAVNFWAVLAIPAGAAVAVYGAAYAVQRALRWARNDLSNRPALWDRFYAFDWGDTTTNNYGYAPAAGEGPQRFQHEMYLQLLERLRAERGIEPGLKLLEVSCGRGGGLHALLERAPEIHATGLDIADSAVRFIEDVGLENVGLNPDVANLIRLHRPVEDWRELYDKTLPYANYWHVKNYTRDERADGSWATSVPSTMETGLINYRQVFRDAVAAGFNGIILAEHYGGDSLGVCATNQKYIRTLLPKA